MNNEIVSCRDMVFVYTNLPGQLFMHGELIAVYREKAELKNKYKQVSTEKALGQLVFAR